MTVHSVNAFAESQHKDVNDTRTKITVRGIVQGVGFRPFIYRLAHEQRLNGYVLNDSDGVNIEVQGTTESIERFIERIHSEHPPLAIITSIHTEFSENTQQYTDFVIRESETYDHRSTLISPDVAVCDDCLGELFDPRNRRYLYPFINCTNCGPRYTIIEDIPYDRPFTSMKHFQMCPACESEYHNPTDRRFHAQPNACFECGPKIWLVDSRHIQHPIYGALQTKEPDNLQSRIEHSAARAQSQFMISRTVELLKQGAIVAVKGLGGFHLAVDATNDDAVVRLRERKHRYEKPLAIMSLDLERIQEYAVYSEAEKQLLLSSQRPIVLLRKKYPNRISANVAPCNEYFGAMLPYTPLHFLLLKNGFLALVMTSGNISEEPIAIDNDEALERLGDIADYFLMHNRDVYLRSDDSVVRMVTGKPTDVEHHPNRLQESISEQRLPTDNRQPATDNRYLYIRRSRGYIPTPVFLKDELPEILAVGAELKNTVCLTKGKNAFLSQHIGDLENVQTLDFFEMTIKHLKRILQINPTVIAYDLHPEYLSTKWALESFDYRSDIPPLENSSEAVFVAGDIRRENYRLIGVQHHHAHIASCLAEHQMDAEVIGIALDGVGYGADEKIWGGEILVADLKDFKRVGHFEYVPMPGGTAAIREPWRMAVSYLYHTYGDEVRNLGIDFIRHVDKAKLEILLRMIQRQLNSPFSSSCGRLFDAVAAIIGIRNTVAYEGQAAMELEHVLGMVDGRAKMVDGDGAYALETVEGDSMTLISARGMIRAIVDDVMHGIPQSVISLKFHNALVNVLVEICHRLREQHQLNTVALSGGCFQNVYLLSRLNEKLLDDGFGVLSHSRVPPNDGGIALGQAVIAGTRCRTGS